MSPHRRSFFLSPWLVIAFVCPPVLLIVSGCHGNSSSIPNINNAAAFLEDNAVYLGPSMVSPRYGHTGTTLEDGTVLIVGGSDERHLTSIDAAEIFDQGASVSISDPVPPTISGDFIDTDVEGNLMLLTQGGRVFHTATLLPDGNVFICGGTGDALFAQSVDTSEIFDISTREFAPDFLQLNEDINVSRFRHSATLLPNGKVLIAGGHSDPSDIGRFEREARAVARLRHPAIVEILAQRRVGLVEDRQAMIAKNLKIPLVSVPAVEVDLGCFEDFPGDRHEADPGLDQAPGRQHRVSVEVLAVAGLESRRFARIVERTPGTVGTVG